MCHIKDSNHILNSGFWWRTSVETLTPDDVLDSTVTKTPNYEDGSEIIYV